MRLKVTQTPPNMKKMYLIMYDFTTMAIRLLQQGQSEAEQVYLEMDSDSDSAPEYNNLYAMLFGFATMVGELLQTGQQITEGIYIGEPPKITRLIKGK